MDEEKNLPKGKIVILATMVQYIKGLLESHKSSNEFLNLINIVSTGNLVILRIHKNFSK
jgi:hypothetical protein